MHVKSCPKLLRSELRLDLAHHRGALLRRGPSQRVPLAALSTNTLRCCGPAGGAVVGAVARAKENGVFTDDEALDVWSVIKPGHVREKIALFAHDSDRKAKGGYDVTAKRRRRTSQIQAALQSPEAVVTLKLQPAIVAPPVDHPVAPPVEPPTAPPVETSDDDAKLSVVEMVAFLEQHVITRSPHAKLRSSASITLSRAPPPPSTAADPHPAPPSVDRSIAVKQGEEPPESVSVSDMVAKLESQCLRRRTQTERRTVGRVLLAEQNHAPFANFQPISASKPLKATPTPSSTAETRKTSVSLRKSDVKVKVTPCFSTDTKVVIKTPTKPTPTLSEWSDAIGQEKTESPPSSSHSKLDQFCKSDKSLQAKPKTTQKCDFKETQKSTADIVAPEINTKAETPSSPEVGSANIIKAEDKFCDKNATKNTTDPKLDDTLKTVCTSSSKSKNKHQSEFKTKKSTESATHEEPMPGLLFLTPPSKSCIQSEQRNPLNAASSLSPNSVQSEQRKADRRHSSSVSDSLGLLSQDLTAQSQIRMQCSFSTSDQSEKRKRLFAQSPAFDSCPIRTLQSNSRDLGVQSEKRKAKSDSNLSRCSLDLVIQSDPSKPSSVQSERSCSAVAKFSLDQTDQSHNSSASFSQSEKRKSCSVTASELRVQSESSIELLPLESQSHRRRLNRIAQSEKRKSCPVMVSDWSNSHNGIRLQTQNSASAFTSQSEQRKCFTAPASNHSEVCLTDIVPHASSEVTSRSSSEVTSRSSSEVASRSSSEVASRSSSDVASRSSSDVASRSSSEVASRSSSDVASRSSSEVVLLRSCSDVGSDRRRRRKAARAFSLCSVEGAGRYLRASEDFLLMRRRVQNLLEPRSSLSYLSLLPHHLLLQILLLLPTRALAALKCTCHYLRLVIDTYDPRPRDALWVCDPRYRDDPCKQCKRRHQRGDVSLCRWHHKPFCQAMPYGPGYWMCCHGDRRDAPGCNVGLHDNRWVPAFHSINAPIYRQRPRDEPDQT